MAQTGIQGEYAFRRQEMVAAFNFSSDGRFEFFYSYGAADRSATGRFMVEGDTLKLKSDKEAGNDFAILKQSKRGNGFKVTCRAPNPFLLSYMQCIAFVGDQKHFFDSDKEGIINIDLPQCDKLYVRNLIFPDIPSLVKDEANTNDHFEVELLASVQQVSFKGIDFHIISDTEISCYPNYFMPMEGIVFKKE